MKSGVGSAPGGCRSTGAFNVPVRKKRGRTAPPSSRCLRGKKDDNVMGSDDANHASNVEATAVKKTTAEDKYSQAIMDDQVYKAEMNSTSSDDESDEEVEDVKVCDICGDVGDEEKLAVCNRCNDGAEHIYCMRVMMENVPEGEWFCEECQAEVDFEKKKLEKSQVKVGTSKEESTEGKISKPVSAVQSISSCENEVDAETVGREEWNEANQGIDTVTRRKEEDARIMPVAKQSIPEPVVLSTGSDSRRRIPLSRDNSFRLAMEKGKQPTPQVPTLLASSAAKNQAPPLAGQLSKSTSFNNSKVPKVKQLVTEAPNKTKTLKAQLTCSVKREGPMGLTTKSATFKKPKTCETAIKAKSSITPPAEELTVMNLPVRRNASNDRGTSILGCPSITGPMAFPVQSKAESAAQRLTTGNNTANSSNLGVANEQGGENTLGNSELNKPLLAKAPVSITSTSSERSLGILGSGAQRNVFQNSEASHSEFCGADRLSLSAIEPPSERKDASAKRNGMSEANSLIATMSSDLMDKSSQAFSPGDKTMVSTLPELDYIWQGDFELWRTGRSPELCDGFQAHLSCSASPKVLEVAKKFPSRVQLEELPRQDSWPIQFQKNGPTYDSIGVFFFARDTHSYEHHYSKLVQNMLNNDLALRGNIGTAELLIFPSNILSKNSQRWNMFYFLWGVFRVKRKDHRNLPPDVPRSECQPNLNEDPVTMDLHTSVWSSSQSFSEDQNNGAKPDCNLVKSATCADHQCLQASEANHEGCSNGENSSGQPLGGTDLEDHCHDSARTCCLTNSRGSINGFSSAQAIKDKRADNRSRVINFNNAESLMHIYDVNCIEGNSGAVNHVSHASGGAQKRKVDTANWTEVNGLLDKKIKLDNISSPVESSLSENIRDGRLSSKVYPLAALSVDDCTDNKAMAGTSKSNGKCIFPLDLNVADDAGTGNGVTILSSDDEDLPEQNTQDQARAGGQHIF